MLERAPIRIILPPGLGVDNREFMRLTDVKVNARDNSDTVSFGSDVGGNGKGRAARL
jgi:hypothetical protein